MNPPDLFQTRHGPLQRRQVIEKLAARDRRLPGARSSGCGSRRKESASRWLETARFCKPSEKKCLRYQVKPLILQRLLLTPKEEVFFFVEGVPFLDGFRRTEPKKKAPTEWPLASFQTVLLGAPSKGTCPEFAGRARIHHPFPQAELKDAHHLKWCSNPLKRGSFTLGKLTRETAGFVHPV